jgi:hypothetical protein
MSEVTVTSDISGAPNIARIAALATTNATVIKAGSGNVFGILVAAPAAAATAVYLKFFDKATAPAPATDTPLFTQPVVSTTSLAGFIQIGFEEGMQFKNGISYAIVNGVADLNNVAVAADSLHGFVLWK